MGLMLFSIIILGCLTAGIKYCSGILHIIWVSLGICSLLSFLFVYEIESTAFYLFNYCEVYSQIFQDESDFNATVAPYMYGFEEVLVPCLFRNENNLFNYVPFSGPFAKLKIF